MKQFSAFLGRNAVAVMEQKQAPGDSAVPKEPIFAASTLAGRENWRSIRTVLGVRFPLGFLAFAACSAGSNGTSSGITGGDGGSSASAGSGIGAINAGGSSASGGSGGSSAGGTGGMVMVSGSSGDTSGAGSSGMGCNPLMATSTVLVPTVELLVDTSSSMWETMPPAWPILYSALMDPGAGVDTLQGKIRFGFASYKGFKGTSETDMACATMTTVAPDLDNHDAINAAYKAIGDGYKQGDKWETPTSYGINYAANILGDYNPMPPGPKYILLVTDGNPNTCVTTDPQCGQDFAIKAAQDAFAAGIGLFILGIGDIVTSPDNGCPTSARCGMSHLQDMANAGVGAGVQPPPGCDDPADPNCQYKYAGCNPGNLLTAAYSPGAPDTGTPFSVDTSASGAQAALTAKLTALLNSAASCTFDLDAIVTGNAALGNVTLDGNALTYGDTATGWALEDNKYQVTLQGSACETYRSGEGHHVAVSFPCDMGKPIAEPR
jgi:hypothetical protein